MSIDGIKDKFCHSIFVGNTLRRLQIIIPRIIYSLNFLLIKLIRNNFIKKVKSILPFIFDN